MNSQQAYDFITAHKIVAGMRGDFTVDVTIETCKTLMNEGIFAFELMMNNSTDPVAVMHAVRQEFGAEVCVGIGTVLDCETAKRVVDAKADFVVSPAFQPDVVEVVREADILMGPGVITPSEAVAAWNMDVKLLKLFPIGSLGVDYYKAIFAPLDHIKFMCNGGMTADNAGVLLKAGAVACGMAGWLTGDGSMPQDVIRERAKQLMAAIR